MILETYSLLSTTFEVRWSVVDGSVEDLSMGWWSVVSGLVKELSVGWWGGGGWWVVVESVLISSVGSDR